MVLINRDNPEKIIIMQYSDYVIIQWCAANDKLYYGWYGQIQVLSYTFGGSLTLYGFMVMKCMYDNKPGRDENIIFFICTVNLTSL